MNTKNLPELVVTFRAATSDEELSRITTLITQKFGASVAELARDRAKHEVRSRVAGLQERDVLTLGLTLRDLVRRGDLPNAHELHYCVASRSRYLSLH